MKLLYMGLYVEIIEPPNMEPKKESEKNEDNKIGKANY